jgi:hypothetical protein
MSRLFTYFLSFILFLTSIFIDNLLGQDFKSQLKEIKKLTEQGQRETALKKTEVYIDKALMGKAYGYAVEGYAMLAENSLIEEDSVISVLSTLENKALSSESPMKELLALELGKIYLRYHTTSQLTRVESAIPIPGELSKFKTHPNTKDKEWMRKYAFAWLNMASENRNLKNFTQPIFFENLLIENYHENLLPLSMFDFVLRYKSKILLEFFPSWFTIPENLVLELLSNKYNPKVFSENPYISQWQKDQTELEDYLSSIEPTYQEYEVFKRLSFFKKNAIVKSKNALVRLALDNCRSNYKSEFFTLQLAVNLCEENPKKFKKAISLINELVSDEYVLKAKRLRESIYEPTILLTAPASQEPGKPILFKIEWRNLSKVNIEVYKLLADESDWTANNYDILYKVDKKIHTETIQFNTSESPDLRSALLRTNIPFKEGRYRLMVSYYISKREVFGYVDIHFSNLGLVELAPTDHGLEGIVLNSRTGNPVKGAKISLFIKERDKRPLLLNFFLTDSIGKFIMERKDHYERHYVYITHDQDTMVTNIHLKNNYRSPENTNYNSSQFFTDRKVYRPGQKVLWKVVSMKHDKNKFVSPLEKGTSFQVALKCPNYKDVEKVTVFLNEFSSASGEFLLPETAMPGFYRIENSQGSISFSVEEYKRPNFNVTLEKPSNNYSLGETVMISGKAIALNGSPITNAKIFYKVYRIARRISYHDYNRVRFPNNQPIQINSGFTSTNDNGKFSCSTILQDDFSSFLKNRLFDFIIDVDATDENNETHSSTIFLTAGTSSLDLSIGGKAEIFSGENAYEIFLNNLAGISQRGKVSWVLKKITKPSPKTDFKHRNLNATDESPESVIEVWHYSLNSLEKNFPEYAFTNKSESSKRVKSGKFPIDGKAIWKFNFPNKSGDYEWHGKSKDQTIK